MRSWRVSILRIWDFPRLLRRRWDDRLRAWRSLEAVYLWVLAPGAGEPAAGGGNAAQRSGDVAAQPPDAVVQDHCGLPQGPCGSDRGGMRCLYPVLPGAVAVRGRAAGDRWDQDRGGGEPQAGDDTAADREDERRDRPQDRGVSGVDGRSRSGGAGL